MKRYCILAGLPIAVSLSISWVAQAQIVPTNDATGTIVTPDGDRLRIQGGQTSQDGTNLFHSFDRFNLSERQIADFLANPQLRNILGRIVGGDVSVINGLIQITGGTPNLYLLNPAGIIFGPTARLNVPADFTATTANAIGFGQNAWFSAVGLPDYANLVGTPHRFAFIAPQPNAILNAGELAVPPGQNLTLLGGSVMSTGRLRTPGGEVTIAAVPGERLVRLSQSGQLLSLEVSAIDPATAATLPASALPTAFQLPELLTGGTQGNATSLTVGSDGVMRLAGAGVNVPPQPGAAIVVGAIDVASKGVGGSVNVIGDRVVLTGANINAAGAQGGGTVRLGGEFQGQGAIPNADYSYVDSNSDIQANALYQGPGGQIIVWSDESTQVNGKLAARGGPDGGDGGLIETSGKVGLEVTGARIDARAPQGKPGHWLLDPSNITISDNPTSPVDPGPIFNPPGASANVNTTQIASTLEAGTSVTITTAGGTGGQGNITVQDSLLVSDTTPGPGGELPTFTLNADNNIVINSEIRSVALGYTGPNAGFNVTLSAENTIAVNADIGTGGGNFSSNSASFNSDASIYTNGGTIDITTTGTGGITIGNVIQSSHEDASSGTITLTANQGNIEVAAAYADGFLSHGGGNIILAAPQGSVSLADGATNGGGRIQIDASSNIAANVLDTSQGEIKLVTGGDVTIAGSATTQGGNFIVDGDNFSLLPGIGEGEGVALLGTNGGQVEITANNNVSLGPRAVIQTSGGNFISNSTHFDASGFLFSTFGGNVSITTQGTNSINLNLPLDTSGLVGGNVSLTAPNGNITVDSIITKGSEGPGGNVSLSTQRGTVQVTGTIVEIASCEGASICTLGSPPGTVSITHGGGPENRAFGVGNPTFNGTASSIVASSDEPLEPTQYFDMLPSGGSVNPVTNVTITSVNSPPSLNSANTSFSGVQPGQPFAISFADLNPQISDPDGDNVTGESAAILITSIAEGATLTLNGSPIIPGATFIQAGDILLYTSPSDATGTFPAFTIAAVDPRNNSPFLAVSVPRQVVVTIGTTPPPPPPPPVEPPPPPVEPPPPPVEPPPPPVEPPPPPVEPPPPPVEPPPPPVEPPPPPPPVEPPPVVLVPTEQGAIATALQVVPRPLPPIVATVPLATVDPIVNTLETEFTQTFEQHLGQPDTPTPTATLDQIHDALRQVEGATGIKPALIYLSFVPSQLGAERPITVSPDDQLELVMVTSSGTPPIRRRIANAPRRLVVEVADELRAAVASPDQTFTHIYREPAQQLYQWIIAPLLPDLTAQGIGNLVFIPDVRLRSLPYAALMTDDRFLIEDYSVGLMPSVSLTDTRYVDPRQTSMLAMGLSEGVQGQAPLPAVPAEIDKLLSLWSGRSYLNEQFTVEQLQQTRSQTPYGIVHLATHADITRGSIDRSYIQFWDRRVPLSRDQIRQLQLNNPPVELLGLSACRTALGDEEAELGFAGLAVQSGVKSALASLWFISDAATAALMADFYTVLRNAPIKAEALRQAQLAMATGQVMIEGTEVKGLASGQTLTLPEESVQTLSDRVLSHPYYWAGMTLIGNPW